MAHKVYVDSEMVRFAMQAARANADMREVFLYLLLPADSRTWAGTRRFFPEEPLPYLTGLSAERVLAAVEALQVAGLVHYDSQAQLISMPLIFKMQAYNNHNMISGAVTGGLNAFPDSPVLIPVLEHLAPAEEAAAAEARKKAEAMREGVDKEKALRKVAQMDDLARDLRARLARIVAASSSRGGGAKGHRSPSEAPSKGVGSPLVAPSEGVGSPLEGATSGGEKILENGAALPEAGQNAPKIGPSEGASKGVHVSGPIPHPIPPPHPEDPSQKGFPRPVEGRCREGPPERLGEVLDKIRGQEGSG